MALPAANGRSEKSLEHAEVRLHLPTLPILRDGPVVLEPLPAEAAGAFAGRLVGPAALGRNEPEHAEFVIEEFMVMLGIVAHVADQHIEGMSPVSLTSHAVELDVVGLGAAINNYAEEEVTSGVDDG